MCVCAVAATALSTNHKRSVLFGTVTSDSIMRKLKLLNSGGEQGAPFLAPWLWHLFFFFFFGGGGGL